MRRRRARRAGQRGIIFMAVRIIRTMLLATRRGYAELEVPAPAQPAGHERCNESRMAKRKTAVSAAEIERLARERLGYQDLRPGQLETIRLVLSGHDTLSVMPTGSGKSAIYQIAALVIDGPTVVISPLIALQKDQVGSIAANEDLPDAAVLNSTQRVGHRPNRLE